MAQALHALVSEADTFIAESPVLHMDETRYPREGATNWTWAAVQPKLAVFSILPSRARYVAQGLLGTAEGQQPKGVVVSDRYSAYAFIDAAQRRLLASRTGSCSLHGSIVRYLGAVVDGQFNRLLVYRLFR